jgi:hypothetical protein
VKQTDAVWRTLADAALAGQREWSSAADLAWKAGVGEKLAYKALTKPTEIGAVTRHRPPVGGFSTTDPERVLTLLAANRTLRGARHTTLDAAQQLATTLADYAIGGTRAAVHHLGGRNTVADHAAAILYTPSDTDTSALPEGEGALVFTVDEATLRGWDDGYTSPAQTYADLFAQSGWQASEFRRQLWRTWFGTDDWSRAEERSA